MLIMSNLSALNFRKKELVLTQKRVEYVMQYFIYCYQKMVFDGKTYSKSSTLNPAGTRNNLEEFLNEKLVIDYLGVWENKLFYKSNISDIESIDIFFSNESKQSYNASGVLKDDFIDIKIIEIGISNIWGNAGAKQQIHLAIECKIIENGFTEYVSDIEKMCERNFNSPRLPFEGQIAYINNSVYTHQSVSKGINQNLAKHSIVKTNQDLTPIVICKGSDESYFSKHKRNYTPNSPFTIYHLLLDYSKIIVN